MVQDRPLPRWLSVSLLVPSNSDATVLCSPLELYSNKNVPDKALKFALGVFQALKSRLVNVPAVGMDWPPGLDLDEIDLSVRTRNCMLSSAKCSDIQNITFGDLFVIPNMGIKSVLEFSCSTESAIISAGYAEVELQRTEEIQEMFNRLDSYTSLPWTEQIGSRDPRFSDLWFMSGESGSLADQIEALIENHDEVGSVALCKQFPEIERRIDEIKSQNLEESLSRFLSEVSGMTGLRFEAMLDRFGWGGVPPLTLEEAGEKLGVTRERIRQIQKKISEKIPETQPYLPALDNAITALESVAPIQVDRAIHLLKRLGISKINFHPKSVITAAKDLQKRSTLSIKNVNGKHLVFSRLNSQGVNRLLDIARRLSGASGATNIFEVMDKLDEVGEEVNERRAVKLLKQLDEIRFLTDDWFWMPDIPPHRNRLRNVTRKMLSVAHLISISDIRDGLKREYFFRNSSNKKNFRVPPTNVLIEFFKQNMEFELDENDFVRSTEYLDYKKELGEGIQAVVEILRSTPNGILERDSLREGCEARNVNLNSLEILLTYSPVLEALGSSLYKLRGISASASEVEAVRRSITSKPNIKRVKDHGWSEEGNVYVVVRLPKYHHSFVFGAPSAIKRFIEGQKFNGLMESGKSFGNITVTKDGSVVGVSTYLRRVGADEGDLVKVEFNLLSETATLSIIPEFGDFN